MKDRVLNGIRFLVVGLAFTMMAPPAMAETTPVYAKVSRNLVDAAAKQLGANQPMKALELYESATVADPGNVAAYVGLGHAYQQLGRAGDSMRYYGLALTIDPNDLAALEGQSLGYLAAGKVMEAQNNLKRLRRICASGCPASEKIDKAIAKALEEGGSEAGAPQSDTVADRQPKG